MEGGAGWRVVQDLQDPQDRPKKLILWKMQDSLVAIPHQTRRVGAGSPGLGPMSSWRPACLHLGPSSPPPAAAVGSGAVVI